MFLFFSAAITGCAAKEEKPAPGADVRDPLPSWNETSSKKAIIDFVKKTTTSGTPHFIPVADRIACFDNDGTLWSEQPVYFQLAFAIDQAKALAPQHPEWKTTEPFKSLLAGNLKAVLAGGEKSIASIVAATHSEMNAAAFDSAVKNWIATSVHPKTGKHYNEMVYKPMVELLSYLRDHEYKTFIVSGGGVDFMRAWVEAAYGIPPYQVIGSAAKVQYEVKDGKGEIIKLAALNFIDDKEGKPVGIHQYIGKRPIFTAGNSDGDYAMLQYTTTAVGYPRFGMLVHHTDSIREWSYDRNSHIGKLDKGLTDARQHNWQIVDMQQDWKSIY